MDEPQVLTRQETADILRVSLRTLDRWRDAGVLVPIELGDARTVRYRRDDVDRLVRRAAS